MNKNVEAQLPTIISVGKYPPNFISFIKKTNKKKK